MISPCPGGCCNVVVAVGVYLSKELTACGFLGAQLPCDTERVFDELSLTLFLGLRAGGGEGKSFPLPSLVFLLFLTYPTVCVRILFSFFLIENDGPGVLVSRGCGGDQYCNSHC